MLAPPDDDTTPWLPLRTGKCSACQAGQSECFAYPSTNLNLVLCAGCIRGVTIAVAKETRRRNVTRVAKT